MTEARSAYKRAGVDVGAGELAVELMRASIESTRRGFALGGLGGFGSAVPVPPGYREPVMVSSTDGVGTKTAIASALSRFDSIGEDLVAMCVDDVVCLGADPIFFLDYIAVGQIVPEGVAELVRGIARGCELAGCELVGGETAEHPGLMPPEAFDLAGFCVGIVERDRLLDGATVMAGDVVVGLASSGLHANGYSLIRAILADRDLDLRSPFQAVLQRTLGDDARDECLIAEPETAFATLGDVLLTPTRIYAPAVLAARRRLIETGADVHAIAHVTGGGMPGNVTRVIPEHLGVRIDPAAWPMPSVMRLFGGLGGLEDDELRSTFNGGVGMTIVVGPAAAPTLIAALKAEGERGWPIGEVRPVEELDGRRYVEAAR